MNGEILNPHQEQLYLHAKYLDLLIYRVQG